MTEQELREVPDRLNEKYGSRRNAQDRFVSLGGQTQHHCAEPLQQFVAIIRYRFSLQDFVTSFRYRTWPVDKADYHRRDQARSGRNRGRAKLDARVHFAAGRLAAGGDQVDIEVHNLTER